ncbi:MAG: hypothetical protein ACJLS3_07815 [Erythrobacter sp.]
MDMLFLGYVDRLMSDAAFALESLHCLALHGEGTGQLGGKGRVPLHNHVPTVESLNRKPHHHHMSCRHLRSERRL